MTTFLFHFTLLPESQRDTSQAARVLAKGTLPALIVLGQAIIIALAMRLVLGISAPHPASFYTIIFVSALSFLSIILALVVMLGDGGRLLALVLLVFQLGAAGGVFPIELSPSLFQKVHEYLPVTGIIKALRASFFGSYGGDWQSYTWKIALIGLAFLILALLIGRRWRYISDEQYSLALNL
jgi:putative membrane protein